MAKYQQIITRLGYDIKKMSVEQIQIVIEIYMKSL